MVFGPVPRTYEQKLSKKFRRAALRGALSLRLGEGAITVVEMIDLAEFKTKRLVEILRELGLDASGVLIVTDGEDLHLERSARNVPRVKVLRVAGLNVFDVLRYPRLLLTKAAVAAIEARLGDAPKEVTP